MKKEHFIDRVKNSILDYLPEEFRDAEILVREVVKVPAGKRTGLCVRKKDRVVSAVLYLEPYYEKVEEDGIPLGCVLQEIADGIIQAGLGEEQALKVADRVRDYDWVSEHLVIQMFDRDEVQETEDVIIYDFGILSGMVRVMLSDGCSVIATHALLDGAWHVTKERLLEDARKDLALETKGLWDVQNVLLHCTGRADDGSLQETNLLTHPDLEAVSGLYTYQVDMAGTLVYVVITSEGKAHTYTDTNLREGPGIETKSLMVLPTDAQVLVWGYTENGWTKVFYRSGESDQQKEGQDHEQTVLCGYIKSDLLKKKEP